MRWVKMEVDWRRVIFIFVGGRGRGLVGGFCGGGLRGGASLRGEVSRAWVR